MHHVTRPFAWIGLTASALALAGCGGTANQSIIKAMPAGAGKPYINDETKFSESAYGVAASPRVSTSLIVRKGGGRRQVGKPYKIRGKWYVPKEEPGYDRRGQASWYGPNFHGRLTANGEVYDQFALSAAHPTFPLPSYARVTNVDNGRSVTVRVNDRGPYHSKRIIDLSAKGSELLGYQKQGIGNVRVQWIGHAPLHGLDAPYLEASFRPGGVGGSLFAANEVDRFATGSIKHIAADPFAEAGPIDPFYARKAKPKKKSKKK
ncbi:septal ring lytic transglycosylase RlpA family protein [Ahrensia sp. R2A130]|uniref:septal ring lytic transglycosylase RlpA family protein n=1 Tax=Ahrensia sp. R2A130 TaxID=744979 RepID=UPI0001E0C9AB|nr:rare lipoprotein A protein [Ahrensia sp. R2A130]